MFVLVFILFIFGAIAFFILDVFFGYYEEWLKCEALINLAKGDKKRKKANKYIMGLISYIVLQKKHGEVCYEKI